MFGSTRRVGALLRTAVVSAMVLLPAGTAHAFTLATFGGFADNGPITDLAAVPTGVVAGHRSVFLTDDSGLTGFKHDGTVLWSASVPASMFGGGSIDRLAPAADGSIWFSTSDGGPTLGRVNTARQVTAVPLAGASEVQAITATPDGRVFAIIDNQLRPLAADGTPGASIAPISYAQDLRAGADGSVWWIDGQIAGSVSASGQVATYSLPMWPESVSADGRGHAWFGAAGEIVRLDIATGAIDRFPSPNPEKGVAVDHLTTANDGSTWFSSDFLALYGRITEQGAMTSWPITEGVASFATPTSVAAGRDGNVWLGTRASDGGPNNNYLTLLQRVNVVGSAATGEDNRLRPTTTTPGALAPGTKAKAGIVPATSLATLIPAVKLLKLSRGVIRLPMTCAAAACQAEVTLTRKIGRTSIVIAHKTVNTTAGKTVKLGLRLSRPGLKAVRQAGRKGLGVLVNVTLGGKTTRHRLVIKR